MFETLLVLIVGAVVIILISAEIWWTVASKRKIRRASTLMALRIAIVCLVLLSSAVLVGWWLIGTVDSIIDLVKNFSWEKLFIGVLLLNTLFAFLTVRQSIILIKKLLVWKRSVDNACFFYVAISPNFLSRENRKKIWWKCAEMSILEEQRDKVNFGALSERVRKEIRLLLRSK